MSQHSELATQLAQLYRLRKTIQIELSHQEADYAARVIALSPADGWPGKNESQRDIAKASAVLSDEVCQRIQSQIRSLRDDLAQTEADIEAAEALRRGAEWETREGLRRVLGQGGEATGETHEPTDQSFDDTLDRATDTAATDRQGDFDPTLDRALAAEAEAVEMQTIPLEEQPGSELPW